MTQPTLPKSLINAFGYAKCPSCDGVFAPSLAEKSGRCPWCNFEIVQTTQAPTLAEAAAVIRQGHEMLVQLTNWNAPKPTNLDVARALNGSKDFLARLQAHQPEAEAWFNVGAGEQVDTSAECE